MIKQLVITNFRKFGEHQLPLRPMSILVGPNNAGKSTVIEAIRLISLVANRYSAINFQSTPEWLDVAAGTHGVSPSLRDLHTNLKTAFHSYEAPPAIVRLDYMSGNSIELFIGPDEHVFAVLRDAVGHTLTSKAQARHTTMQRIAVQPQVAPLSDRERLLDQQTVQRGMDSSLAPSHFRNQLLILGDVSFGRFKALAESTWQGLQIRDLQVSDDGEGRHLSLYIRDGSFVGEVATMGHGLQMWLQVMWFLARNRDAPTVVLDEPDVYMHADLQRKLVRLLKGSGQQVLVATHSVEILSEVEPSDVLIIDAERPRSTWANNIRGVQKVIDTIGGVHNLQLSRLASSRRCLFVEGDDVTVLKHLHDKLFPNADALDLIPRVSVGGWSGWQRVVGAGQLLRNAAGDGITSYSIFDSDYHLVDEIASRFDEARANHIQLQIWSRKEIENYLLIPSCVQRVISERTSGSILPTDEEIFEKTIEVAHANLQATIDNYVNSYHTAHRDLGVQAASRQAREYVDRRLSEPDGILSVVSGKAILAGLATWSQGTFGATFGSELVARSMWAEEISAEIRGVLSAIEMSNRFDAGTSAGWRARAEPTDST